MSNVTFPVNTETMEYYINRHRYLLTELGIEAELGINLDGADFLGDKKKVPVFLNSISRQIYGYIYQHHFGNNKAFVEYMLAKRPDWREAIEQAMMAQVEYAILSGGNLVQFQHGINFEKGTNIDPKITRGQLQVALGAHQALEQYGVLYSNTPEYDRFRLSYSSGGRGVDY